MNRRAYYRAKIMHNGTSKECRSATGTIWYLDTGESLEYEFANQLWDKLRHEELFGKLKKETDDSVPF